MGAVDAGVTAGAAAATDAFAPGAGGITRAALKTKAGRKVTRAVSWIAVGAAIILILPLFMGAVAMTSIFGGGASVIAAAGQVCFNNGGAGGSPMTDASQEQIAAIIYAQAKGIGLDDNAAMMGIFVGLAETQLRNAVDGDVISGRMMPFRGVFQQGGYWAPPGLAWGGGKPNESGSADTSEYNSSNAWGPGGWAVNDPRLNVAQAANMFFLGPYNEQSPGFAGLEDDPQYKAIYGKPFQSVSDTTFGDIGLAVQQYPAGDRYTWYDTQIAPARAIMTRILAGQVPIPTYQPPISGIATSSSTPWTRNAISGGGTGGGGSTPGGSTSSPTGGSNDGGGSTTLPKQDGILLLGDSIMEGTDLEGGVPAAVYGGAKVPAYQVGIMSSEAVAKYETQIKTGPHTILVSLGANNEASDRAGFVRDVKQIMTFAGSDRQVYWYNMHYDPVMAFNSDLATLAGQYRNLHIVDVKTLLKSQHPEYLSPADKYLHPTTAGYQAIWTLAQATIGNGGNLFVYTSVDCTGLSNGIGVGVGPDGCPTSAIAGLDDGSEAIGVYEICKQAAAAAPTVQAAAAIKQALAWLGAPYACGGDGRQDPFRFDCSSLVSRAYFESSGIPIAGKDWAPSTRDMIPWDGVDLDPHYAFVAPQDLRPGDLVLYRSCQSPPCAYQHVVMYLGVINGQAWQVHTNYCGGVAHVTAFSGTGDSYAVSRRVMHLPSDPPMVLKFPSGPGVSPSPSPT